LREYSPIDQSSLYGIDLDLLPHHRALAVVSMSLVAFYQKGENVGLDEPELSFCEKQRTTQSQIRVTIK